MIARAIIFSILSLICAMHFQHTRGHNMWNSLLRRRELTVPTIFYDQNGTNYGLPLPELTLSCLSTNPEQKLHPRIIRLPECLITVESAWNIEIGGSDWRPFQKTFQVESAEISILLESPEYYFLCGKDPVRIKNIYLGTKTSRNYNYSEQNNYDFC